MDPYLYTTSSVIIPAAENKQVSYVYFILFIKTSCYFLIFFVCVVFCSFTLNNNNKCLCSVWCLDKFSIKYTVMSCYTHICTYKYNEYKHFHSVVEATPLLNPHILYIFRLIISLCTHFTFIKAPSLINK